MIIAVTGSPGTGKSSVAKALCKKLGWDIGFFTGGVGVFDKEEMEFMLRIIYSCINEKIWLNIGALSEEMLIKYKPYIKGVVGSIETINPEVHSRVCPSKPIAPYEKMFSVSNKMGLQNAMTIII